MLDSTRTLQNGVQDFPGIRTRVRKKLRLPGARAVRSQVLFLSGLLGVMPGAMATSTLPGHAGAAMTNKAQIARNYGNLPLRFEANLDIDRKPAKTSVQFLSRGKGYALYLTGQDAVLALDKKVKHESTSTLPADVIHMRLAGANSNISPTGEQLLPGVSNYLGGVDPSKWHTNVPAFSRVRYSSVYPGIDLVYYGNQQQLEYDFVLAPGADPRNIQLNFEGADQLKIDRAGNLAIQSGDALVAFHKPVVYQLSQGVRKPVAGRFNLNADNSVGFILGPYDHAKSLVIDPTLVYSTLLGGSSSDTLTAIAVDASGNAYITGTTASTDYPVTPGVFQTTFSTAFITKLNPSGTALVYSTFLGSNATGNAIAVDSAGEPTIAGTTTSTSFPVTTGAFQATNKAAATSNSTGFVTKLNASGTGLIYSTYLGGTRTDSPTALVLDSTGDAYIAGYAFSADFPTTVGVVQAVNKSSSTFGWNEFITKLNPTGTKLLYSTYLGGSNEYGGAGSIQLATDSSGDAYISGYALSLNFPVTAGAYQTKSNAASGRSNMTLSKITPTANNLLYSTYLGGSGSAYGDDVANALAVDSTGNAYLAGTTHETNYPVTAGAFQTTNKKGVSGLADAFITKMNPTGTALVYSTYLGGSGSKAGDSANGLVIDTSGNAYITGAAASTDFPVSSNAYQISNAAASNSGSNAFLTELNPKGTGLVYSTYFGGAAGDSGSVIALGAGGAVYLIGNAGSTDFPVTPGAYKGTYNSQNFTTGFVAKFNLGQGTTLLPTQTALISNANPAVAGTGMVFNATVAPGTGTGTPTGTIAFNIDQVNVATVALNTLGVATYSTAPLAIGQHAILATYSGSTTYAASANGITESITPAPPVFSPSGGTFPAAQLVSLSTRTPGSTIYYTTDGSLPTSASPKYSAPFLVNTNQTVQAIAAQSNAPMSNVVFASYRLISAPSALAAAATAISTPNATVHAVVNTYGMSASYYFRYGTSIASLSTNTPKVSLPGSPFLFVPVTVTATITGLSPKSTYYYQVVITTSAGTSSGQTLSFTTN